MNSAVVTVEEVTTVVAVTVREEMERVVTAEQVRVEARVAEELEGEVKAEEGTAAVVVAMAC